MYWQSLWLELCGRCGRRAFGFLALRWTDDRRAHNRGGVLYFPKSLVSGRFGIKLLALFPEFRGAVDRIVDLQLGEVTCLLSVEDRIS